MGHLINDLKQEGGYKSYRIFHFMWCLFIFIHHSLTAGAWSKIGSHFLGSGSIFFVVLSLILPALLLLSIFKPDKPIFFAAALLTWTTIKFGNMPFIPNHIVLATVINLALIFTILYTYYKNFKKNSKEKISFVYQTCAPALRWMLIILYFFTVFHKINWAYLDPAVSCGVELYDDIRNSLPFLPQNSGVQWLTILGTLIIEILIPLFLIFPKSRMYGIIMGLGFHFLLAIHPNLMIFSFTSEVYALYVLFLPQKAILKVYENITLRFRQILELNKNTKIQLATGATLFIGVLIFLILYFNPMPAVPPNYQQLIIFFLYLWCSFLIFLAIRYQVKYSGSSEVSGHFLRLPVPVLLIFPLLILLNGFSPYLGLKTATNFSMFSNLKISGNESNHILIPKTYPLLREKDDLLEIVDSDYEPFQQINKNHELITQFEFERIIQNYNSEDPAFLVYIYDNETTEIHLPKDKILPQFNKASWLEKKFIIFRNIPQEDPCPCQW